MPGKFTRTKKIVNIIKESKKVVIDENENFIVDGTATGINVPIFLYDLQQPTKKTNNPDFFMILELPNKKEKENFCANKNQAQRNQPITYRGILRRRKWFQVSKPQRETELNKRRRTVSFSTNEKRLLELKYTKGPAAYESVRNIQKSRNLKPSKMKWFLEGQNAHTKHKKDRKKFPTPKVIAYDINEIWSLDLAYVDKLAKENKDVKYLMVAMDCPHVNYESNPYNQSTPQQQQMRLRK